jgi:hypothetical protein
MHLCNHPLQLVTLAPPPCLLRISTASSRIRPANLYDARELDVHLSQQRSPTKRRHDHGALGGVNHRYRPRRRRLSAT